MHSWLSLDRGHSSRSTVFPSPISSLINEVWFMTAIWITYDLEIVCINYGLIPVEIWLLCLSSTPLVKVYAQIVTISMPWINLYKKNQQEEIFLSAGKIDCKKAILQLQSNAGRPTFEPWHPWLTPSLPVKHKRKNFVNRRIRGFKLNPLCQSAMPWKHSSWSCSTAKMVFLGGWSWRKPSCYGWDEHILSLATLVFVVRLETS